MQFRVISPVSFFDQVHFFLRRYGGDTDNRISVLFCGCAPNDCIFINATGVFKNGFDDFVIRKTVFGVGRVVFFFNQPEYLLCRRNIFQLVLYGGLEQRGLFSHRRASTN